jgi:hypothetical protein
LKRAESTGIVLDAELLRRRKMRKVIVTCCVSALASLALLVPAGSAQASWRTDPFCVGSNINGHYPGQTLVGGSSCSSWPLNVGEIYVSYKVVKAGTGRVCVGLFKYGSSQPVSGAPGLVCPGVGVSSQYARVGQEGVIRWYFPPYSNPPRAYAYGQARIINYSTATIKTIPGFTWVAHWL